MITITENRNFIMQMKDEFKIVEIKKSDIIDFGVDIIKGGKRIIFTTKNDNKVVMHFSDNDQFNVAISILITITDKMMI